MSIAAAFERARSRTAMPLNGSAPVVIRGAPFTFRTLHPLDVILPRQKQAGGEGRPHRAWFWLPLSFDREQTFTMPAVPGLYHNEPASTEVVL